MADTKISAMTALAQGDVAVGTDVLPIVDVGSPNLNKRITPQALVGSAVTDLVQTWNSAGTTFSAIKMNITDTASAAGSLLLDLQVGGVSRFKVDKVGDLRCAAARISSLRFIQGGDYAFADNAGTVWRIGLASGFTEGQIFTAGGNLALSLIANIIEQRNGTNAQTFRIYNTFTDASNYERGSVGWAGNAFVIATENAGTGSNRPVLLQGRGNATVESVLGSVLIRTSSANRWSVDPNGHFLAAVDNTHDIGASGANRPRNLYVASRAIINSLTIGLGGQTAVANNTALGFEALNSASLTGTRNVGVGYQTLLSNTTGGDNSALGYQALVSNTTGNSQTAVGYRALYNNTTGTTNSAVGAQALQNTTTGLGNSAFGWNTLLSNTTGDFNTGLGREALASSTTASDNSAVGFYALFSNTTGSNNSAVGRSALFSNTTGSNNSAMGRSALNSNTTASDNSALGYAALYSNTTGSNNSAVGQSALYSNTTGSNNSAVGRGALESNTTGGNNNAIGFNALYSNTTGVNNSAAGTYALFSNTTGNHNSAVGTSALYYFNTSNNVAVGFEAARGSTTVANNTGTNLTAVGYQALLNNTSGDNNSAVGALALNSNTTGSSNSAVGREALRLNTTGASNSALGRQTLLSNTSGANNSAVGREALYSNTTGGDNSALGVAALYSNTTGSNNSALGLNALAFNTTGSNNTGLGDEAGDVITTGARNTIVGANSDPSANNGNDQTVIGEGLTGKGDDTFFCGGTNGAYNEKNVTTWETTSDARIKKNIVSNGVGLEVISQIDVRNFEYRTPEEITELPQSAAINQPGVQLGVIAQELQAVLPECVTENSTGVLSVNTDPLVWYLVNAVKQLSAEVKTLKGE